MGLLLEVLRWMIESTSAGVSRATIIVLSSGLLITIAMLLISKVPLSYNLNNLRVRWKNTGLTAVAFTLVLSVLTVMLAFVSGMTRLTESSGHPENVMVLSAGTTDEGFSNLGFGDVSDIANQAGVKVDGETKLASKETYMVVNQPLPNAAEGRPKRRFLQLRGIDDPQIAGVVHEVTIGEGAHGSPRLRFEKERRPERRSSSAWSAKGWPVRWPRRLGPGESWQDHSGSGGYLLTQRSHLDHRGSDEVRRLTL